MSTTNRRRDRDEHGRLKRKYRGPNSIMTTPGYWVTLHMNRPRRHLNRLLCHLVTQQGLDHAGIAWPLGNRKPHIYFW